MPIKVHTVSIKATQYPFVLIISKLRVIELIPIYPPRIILSSSPDPATNSKLPDFTDIFVDFLAKWESSSWYLSSLPYLPTWQPMSIQKWSEIGYGLKPGHLWFHNTTVVLTMVTEGIIPDPSHRLTPLQKWQFKSIIIKNPLHKRKLAIHIDIIFYKCEKYLEGLWIPLNLLGNLGGPWGSLGILGDPWGSLGVPGDP